MTKMNPLLPWGQIKQLALSGGSILFFGEAMARLSAYLMGRFSLQGKSITLVDASQSFDPYLVARVGRFIGNFSTYPSGTDSPQPGLYLPPTGNSALRDPARRKPVGAPFCIGTRAPFL